MERPSLEEAAKVVHFAQSEGWQITKRVIQKQIDFLTTQLIMEDFDNLAESASLQGEIRAYKDVLQWVENRKAQLEKGGTN